MDFQLLEFDSTLFGFKVAKILTPKLSLKKLQAILHELREQNIRLVYWTPDSTDKTSQQAAKKLGGFLGSEHITYLLNLKTLNPIPTIAPEIEIYEHQQKLAATNMELEELAIQAGTYSHFNTDPNFPKELFLKLYRTWIENSINGSIASKIMTVYQENKIAGMITLGTKNGRGDIGLLAVNPNFRGKNLGTKLVSSAQAYFIESGFSLAQVVTQKANLPACRLYEKCGFHREKIENFYHFWP